MNDAQASASEKSPPILRPMNITHSRLAKAIGVDPRRIQAIVHGQRSMNAETALLLSLLRDFRPVLDAPTEPV